MNSPIIKPPTSEVFYFPTSADVTDGSAAAAKGKAPRGSDSKKAVTKAASKAAVSKAVTKAGAKAATKAVTKKNERKPAKAEVRADAAAPKKAQGAKKEKVQRDSFTMPKSDYAKIGELKQRCLDAGVKIKRSEILRAGLLLLAATSPKQLLSAVAKVETVKTGRPAKA